MTQPATAPAAPAAAPTAPAAPPAPSPSTMGGLRPTASNLREGLAAHRAAQATMPMPPADGSLPTSAAAQQNMRHRADDSPVSPEDLFQSRSQFDQEVTPDPNAPADEAQAAQDPQAPNVDAELFHGMSKDEVWQALQNGEVPEALWDKLKIRQKVNGEEIPVTLAEYRENGMRLSDYSRAHQALAAERTEFAETRSSFDALLTAWADKGNAQLTVEAMMDAGLPLHEISEAYAKDWAKGETLRQQASWATDPRATPQQKFLGEQAAQLLQEREAIRAQKAEARKQQLEQARQQGTQGKQQTQQAVEAANALIKNELPGMFQQSGIADTPHSREVLKSFLRQMVLASPEKRLTRKLLADGVQATREHLSDLAKRHMSTTGGNGAPRVGAGAAPGGGPAPVAVSRQPSAFRDFVQARRGR